MRHLLINFNLCVRNISKMAQEWGFRRVSASSSSSSHTQWDAHTTSLSSFSSFQSSMNYLSSPKWHSQPHSLQVLKLKYTPTLWKDPQKSTPSPTKTFTSFSAQPLAPSSNLHPLPLLSHSTSNPHQTQFGSTPYQIQSMAISSKTSRILSILTYPLTKSAKLRPWNRARGSSSKTHLGLPRYSWRVCTKGPTKKWNWSSRKLRRGSITCWGGGRLRRRQRRGREWWRSIGS